MVCGIPSATASSKLVSWCLLLLQLQASRGFLVPALQSSPSLDAADFSIRPATASAEAEHTSGNTSLPGDDNPAASCAPGLSVGSTPFQKFVERRRSAAHRVVLDLRPAEEFRRRHLKGSTSIPVDELATRLLELPPPFGQPLSIVGNEEDRRAADDFLTQKGWQIDTRIGPNLAPVDADMSAESWPTEAGSKSRQVWRANEFLEFCMESFLLPASSAYDNTAAAADGAVLDLGCGSGRDTVFMAQHLPPGTRVIGVDNHSFALERGARLAEQWLEVGGGGHRASDYGTAPSLADVASGWEMGKVTNGIDGEGGAAAREAPPGVRRRACEWLLADLRKEGCLDGVRASVVHGHRFKCEQLLPLLRDDVLLPGGCFIWSTFLDTGTENLVPPWRPSRMMRYPLALGAHRNRTRRAGWDLLGQRLRDPRRRARGATH
eukprot:g14701.t1